MFRNPEGKQSTNFKHRAPANRKSFESKILGEIRALALAKRHIHCDGIGCNISIGCK